MATEERMLIQVLRCILMTFSVIEKTIRSYGKKTRGGHRASFSLFCV